MDTLSKELVEFGFTILPDVIDAEECRETPRETGKLPSAHRSGIDARSEDDSGKTHRDIDRQRRDVVTAN